MKNPIALSLLTLVLLAGCATKEASLKGTWKARQEPVKSSNNLGDVMQSSALQLATQNMSIEFDGKNNFKISQIMGWGEGTYQFEGDVLVLKLKTLSPMNELRLKFGKEANTLELERKFDSDPTVTFVKQ